MKFCYDTTRLWNYKLLRLKLFLRPFQFISICETEFSVEIIGANFVFIFTMSYH